MTTELATVDLTQLPVMQVGSDEDFKSISKGAGFLRRLQLFTKGKAINKGLIGPGHWGIPVSDEEVIDMGTSLDVIPLCRRTKAVDMSDREAIIVSYEAQSPEFLRIKKIADSKVQDSGCMYGSSFLVLTRDGEFLELFFGSASSRSEADKVAPFLPAENRAPSPCTLKVRLVEKKSFSWHVPVVQRCGIPFESLPTVDTIQANRVAFTTIKNEGSEVVTEEENTGKKKRAR